MDLRDMHMKKDKIIPVSTSDNRVSEDNGECDNSNDEAEPINTDVNLYFNLDGNRVY